MICVRILNSQWVSFGISISQSYQAIYTRIVSLLRYSKRFKYNKKEKNNKIKS